MLLRTSIYEAEAERIDARKETSARDYVWGMGDMEEAGSRGLCDVNAYHT